MRPLARWLLALTLAACGPSGPPGKPPLYPIGPVPTRPESVTFLLPGALTTAAIFGPATGWGDATNLVIEYRLPGMEGEPLDRPLTIEQAAAWVAQEADRYPDAEINLFGYSTGAAIALTAAARIKAPSRVRVAAMSSATPFPGTALALLRAGPQLAAAALDELRLGGGTLNRNRIWENYAVTLMLGPGWRQDPDRRDRGRWILERWRNRIDPPDTERTSAQASDLLVWSRPQPQPPAMGPQIIFLHGGRDPAFPLWQIRLMAASLPARVCVWPEGGHLLYLNAPDPVRRVETWFFDPAHPPPCGP